MTVYHANRQWLKPLVVPCGRVIVVQLAGTAGACELELHDNAECLKGARPSLYGSIDNGETFTPMGVKLMHALKFSENDLWLSIDCSQMQCCTNYIIKGVTCSKPAPISDGVELRGHYWSDASQTAFDEDALKQTVRNNIMELGDAAQDNAAWTIKYYKADAIKNIDVLNAYELKSITTCKNVRAFFPHRKTIGQLDFDQFGLSYEELTNLHILRSEFERVYEQHYARPARLDIVYIPFLDQFFEVNECLDVKSPTNEIQYYDLTLKVLSDRQSVAKQDDLLDISDMVDGTDREAMHALKDEFVDEHTYEERLCGIDAMLRDNGNGILYTMVKTDKFKIVEHEMKIWHMQNFSKCKIVHIKADAKPCYMVYFDTADNEWRRGEYVDNVFTSYTLAGKELDSLPLTGEDQVTIEVSKFAQFNEPLSNFERNMYFTSPNISRNLQPLDLVELQTTV